MDAIRFPFALAVVFGVGCILVIASLFAVVGIACWRALGWK